MAVSATLAPVLAIGAWSSEASMNQLSYEVDVADVDATLFSGGGYTSAVAGMKTLLLTAAGFNEYSTAANTSSDELLCSLLGSASEVTAVCTSNAAGEIAVMTRGFVSNHKPVDGKVGDLPALNFKVSPVGNRILQGYVSVSSASTVSGATNGTGFNLGLLAAGQYCYATVHMLTRTGTLTLTPLIEADDNSGFSSAATQTTGSAMSAVGSQLLTVAGAVATETYWRVRLTASGTGTATMLVAIGFGA